MAVPDDPMDVAARFWAQLLGFEISYDVPTPGSPVWGMILVRTLAAEAGRTEAETAKLAGDYLGARWDFCYPEVAEAWGEPPYPPRTHDHRDG